MKLHAAELRGIKGVQKPFYIGRGHVVSPSKLTPSSFFIPQQSCEEFF